MECFLADLKLNHDMEVDQNSEFSLFIARSNLSFPVKAQLKSSSMEEATVAGFPMVTTPTKLEHSYTKHFSQRYRRSRSRGSNRSFQGGTQYGTESQNTTPRALGADSRKIFGTVTRQNLSCVTDQGVSRHSFMESQKLILCYNSGGKVVRGRARGRQVQEQYRWSRSEAPSPRPRAESEKLLALEEGLMPLLHEVRS